MEVRRLKKQKHVPFNLNIQAGYNMQRETQGSVNKIDDGSLENVKGFLISGAGEDGEAVVGAGSIVG